LLNACITNHSFVAFVASTVSVYPLTKNRWSSPSWSCFFFYQFL